MSGAESALLSIRTEGGLLPTELLHRVRGMESDLPRMKPEDYHLVGERLEDAMNRAWARLKGVYREFRERLGETEGAAAVGLTRDRWLLPLFQALDYGRLNRTSGLTADGQPFAISHAWGSSPIHLLGWGVPLDVRSAGVAGASKASPHGLVQDFLNRSDDHLWGFVSNGRTLRVLRDHLSLTRQAYVEFDLEAIFEGDQWFDFQLLWLVCHESRVQAERPELCALEAWFEAARNQGVRALDQLRTGVEAAIEHLGTGFVAHRANGALQARLESGELNTQDLYRQVLRLVYRLIFLFVAEERGVLLDPAADPAARARYERFYSTRALRDLADRRGGTGHGDRWQALKVVMEQLRTGGPELGLPALGSFLWSSEALPDLLGAQLANEHLLAAIRPLSRLEDTKQNQSWRVSWRNVGAEELGSVYESLLERHPEVHARAGRFSLRTAAGNDRKTTGSYYTPSSLVDCLLDSALDPVLEETVKGKQPADAEKALLALTVCDPACGSGHFLVAAARRIARRLAQVRSGDVEPSPEATRHALRDVVGRCLYGVDVNPMAVELCKVSLWMEAVEPGRPLSFLDGHIQCGNALLGTTPALMARGIPDNAWAPITGDDKEVAKRLKKRNRDESRNQETMYGLWAADSAGSATYLDLASRAAMVEDRPDSDLAAVQEKEAAWERVVRSNEARQAKFLADAWCASFVWPKTEEFEDAAPTDGMWRRMRRDPTGAPKMSVVAVRKVTREHAFFHWHLAFPHVFGRSVEEFAKADTTGWTGGFDVVFGNPPWDSLIFREAEFFAIARPDIAAASTAAIRKRLIRALASDDPILFSAFADEARRTAGANSFARDSGAYPLTGIGRVNLYALFAERARDLVRLGGRIGQILPSGIVTDHSTKLLFQAVVESGELKSFLDFENRSGIFSSVHRSFKFGLITLARGGGDGDGLTAEFAFFSTSIQEAQDLDRRFSLTAGEIQELNPISLTCPIFRSRRDAEITKKIYRAVPVLARSGWEIDLRRFLNSADDSADFSEERGEGRIPLYQAKYFHHYNHRWATHEHGRDRRVLEAEWRSAEFHLNPRFWYSSKLAEQRFGTAWGFPWVLAWRRIARSTDERTMIATVLPSRAVPDTAKVFVLPNSRSRLVPSLVSNLSSFAFDYVVRQKVGGTDMSAFIVEQLPVLGAECLTNHVAWSTSTAVRDWLSPRSAELIYTAWDLQPFANDVGWHGPPFHWDEERRFTIRAELDAAFFHLYRIERGDVDYIMDTFPIVKKKDVKAHGSYRTKTAILHIYDRMQQAIDTGVPYETVLDPPPAHPSLAHPPRYAAS